MPPYAVCCTYPLSTRCCLYRKGATTTPKQTGLLYLPVALTVLWLTQTCCLQFVACHTLITTDSVLERLGKYTRLVAASNKCWG
jgi:hypothetical protein